MEEGGLLLANLLDLPEYGGAQKGRVMRLTWQGHEFADAAQNASVWSKAKLKVLSTGGALTVESLKIALDQLVRGNLG